MKDFKINIEGRIKNFNLPKKNAIFSVFEAITNSINAIDERIDNYGVFENPEICITIIRNNQPNLGLDISDISGIFIEDNGIGFNDVNFESFLSSDSSHKYDIGGKGVGRFSWLKVFESVDVDSTYICGDEYYRRLFTFKCSSKLDDNDEVTNPNIEEMHTSIMLKNPKSDYIKYLPKDIKEFAKEIINHFVVFFSLNNCPKVILKDEENIIDLNEQFKQTFSVQSNEKFKINDYEFEIKHIFCSDEKISNNYLYWCANNRMVKKDILNKHIPNLTKNIFEDEQHFYICILSGEYLDMNVNMNRTDFIDEDDTFMNISMAQIVRTAIYKIKNILSDYLNTVNSRKLEKIVAYTKENAPQYTHLLNFRKEEIDEIEPDLSDVDLDARLNSIKHDFDCEIKKEKDEVINNIVKNDCTDDIVERTSELLKKVSKSSEAALAEYVVKRKSVLDVFQNGLGRQEDGKFKKEEFIHNIIYPMKQDSLTNITNNLWLIDERLSYTTYIASDNHFDDKERADIFILDKPVAVSDGNDSDYGVYNSITIFELKRPMRKDYSDSENPINQLIDYAIDIKDGKIKSVNGREIKISDSTAFYLYAVCDITDSLKRIIKKHGYRNTPDKLGYFGYIDDLNAYIEVLSFDKLVGDAKKRNNILFEKLGIRNI